jgi:hypothetical protein
MNTIDITITTSLLSIIGACVIFLTFALKWKNSETDRELMTFLVCLTIADLFIAVGCHKRERNTTHHNSTNTNDK